MNIPSPSFDSEWREWADKLVGFFKAVTITAPQLTTGAIVDFHTSVQSGFLLCDGSVFSAATYPALAQLLGGTTLPNLTSAHGAGYVVGIKV